jgi:hypothetical protein
MRHSEPPIRRCIVFLASAAVLTALGLTVGCGGPGTTPSSISPAASQELVARNDLETAREALITFFSLLNERRYSEAAQFYGGDYDALRAWNPTIAPDDYATLFEYGCTQNGLECLRVRTIVSEEVTSPTDFGFIVEFMNEDGTLFSRGPCCGATESEMPPETQFEYRVRKIDSRFLVQDLPVYVA